MGKPKGQKVGFEQLSKKRGSRVLKTGTFAVLIVMILGIIGVGYYNFLAPGVAHLQSGPRVLLQKERGRRGSA